MEPDTPPELLDLAAWLDATESSRRELLDAVCAELGPDFGTVYGDPAPVERPDPDEPLWTSDDPRRATLGLAALQGGLRIEHGPSGILFALIPGGIAELGFSDEELAWLDSADLLDSVRGEALWLSGELHLLHRAVGTMRWRRPLREGKSDDLAEPTGRGTVRLAMAPFLLAEAPLTGTQLASLGYDVDGRRRAWTGPEITTYVDPDEVDELPLRALGLRLPSEAEWEYACRAGTRSPFHWGYEPPSAFADPQHPLGLAALGHFAEAVSDPWRSSWDSAPDPELGTRRGGAASNYPWESGSAGWRLLMSAHREPWLRRPRASGSTPESRLARQSALRPAISLPIAAPALPAQSRRSLPAWRLTRRANTLLSRLVMGDANDRAAARDEIRKAIAGPGVWTGQAVAALPWLFELIAQESLPDRPALLTLVCDLVCGDHAAVLATGLDRGNPIVAEAELQPAARALRIALVERLERLSPLANDIDPQLRGAFAMLGSVLPEAEPLVRPRLVDALARETDPSVKASQLLGLGRLDRWARRVEPAIYHPHFASPEPLVRGASRLALLATRPDALAHGEKPLSTDHTLALLDFVRDASPDPVAFPWHGAALGPLCATWLAAHLIDGTGAIHAGLLMARLVREAGLDPEPRLETWARAAIHFGLSSAAASSVHEDARWSIVADLSRRELPDLDAAWLAAGLPTAMGERRALVVRHRGRL